MIDQEAGGALHRFRGFEDALGEIKSELDELVEDSQKVRLKVNSSSSC